MPSSILHAAVVARKLVGRHYQRYAQPTPSLRPAYGLDQIHGEGLWWL